MSLRRWMDDNLLTRGYGIPEQERRRLAVGLRFSPTAVCLALVDRYRRRREPMPA